MGGGKSSLGETGRRPANDFTPPVRAVTARVLTVVRSSSRLIRAVPARSSPPRDDVGAIAVTARSSCGASADLVGRWVGGYVGGQIGR